MTHFARVEKKKNELFVGNKKNKEDKKYHLPEDFIVFLQLIFPTLSPKHRIQDKDTTRPKIPCLIQKLLIG